MNNPIACITGATAGFGEAIARMFVAQGYRVILTGRRAERLETIARELANAGGEARCLCFDIRSRSATETALAELPEEWQTWKVLVNNAGLALGREFIEHGDPDDWDTMIDTNVKGLLYMTRAALPMLHRAGNADLVNIGSIAGKEVYPGGNVYCASKFAVDALSKALRVELIHTGVRVCQISPGAADTEFSRVRYKGDTTRANAVYDGFEALTADDIAEAVWFAVSRPQNVCINDMTIVPKAQANSFAIHKSTT